MSPFRGAIVTAAGPSMRAILHDHSLPSFREYGREWGWSVCAHDLETDGVGADRPAQQAKWAKLQLLRTALADFPVVLWLDADVLITRVDEDIALHLRGDVFQALALEQVPAENRLNPNTGVWLLRSGPHALAFLDAVERAGRQPGPWADQGAVLAALGWDRGDRSYHGAKPGRGSRFLRGTGWLPTSWNQPYQGSREGGAFNSAPDSYASRPSVPHPHAVHFMGMTPQARYDAMARFRSNQARPSIPYPTRAHLGALMPAR